MRPSSWQPPVETSAAEEHILRRVKRAKLFVFPRRHRHQLFTPGFQAELAGLYKDSPKGSPPVAPAMLALALILQAYSGVSDDEVIEATLMDRRWQVARDCLEAQEPPFSKSTLIAFRARLIEHQMDRRWLERTVEIAAASQACGPQTAAHYLHHLQHTVCAAHEFQRMRALNQALMQPLGDALALVFFNDPEAMPHCALEVSRTLPVDARRGFRTGIHAGPVERHTHEDGSEAAAGEAIWVARLLAGCGEGGHILISGEAADALNRVANWLRYLTPLGRTALDDGTTLTVFNLYNDETGNPTTPSGLSLIAEPQAGRTAGLARVTGRYVIVTPQTAQETQETVTLIADTAPTLPLKHRLQVRQTFHGLTVHSVLGEGAMGAAHLASHPVLQMPLVIKTFKGASHEGLFKEAHLAARVASPNVVGVIDAGVEDDVPFVIQKYVDGVDLAELVRYSQTADWRIPVNMICHLAIDVAQGLHAIHQAGVIHRDVKPANLFLNGNSVATVGDFGIAVDAGAMQDAQNISGTPSFMAPEQWEQRPLRRQTDIYALGATLHLLATGRPPFTGNALRDLYNAHVGQPYRPPAATTPEEAYLYSVIERTLRKDPADRYPTAEALARALRVIAEPKPQYMQTQESEAWVGSLHIRLCQGDLAESEADVIVNSSGIHLTMNVGVAAALRRAGGPEIEQEVLAHAPASMGDVIWTTAGKLKARHLAHAAAALRGAICLQRCALRSLFGAEVRQARTVAFPALGTGVGDVPMDLAAKAMLEAIGTFAAFQPRYVREIQVVLRQETNLARWRSILRSM